MAISGGFNTRRTYEGKSFGVRTGKIRKQEAE